MIIFLIVYVMYIVFFCLQEKKVYFVAKLTAHLAPMPVCSKCLSKNRGGVQLVFS